MEIAIDGTLYIAPSIAAETVPEYSISVPQFNPLFIPEITKSISLLSNERPACVQSAGVPTKL